MGQLIMSNSANDVGLALLSALEARAKKKGRKSVVKDVLRRLRASGAGEMLLAEVAALCGKKAKARKKDAHAKAAVIAKDASKPKDRAKPKATSNVKMTNKAARPTALHA